MNRRVLAALLTLADVHQAKELCGASGGRQGGSDLSDAHKRHGYCLRLLSSEEYALYEGMAINLCQDALSIDDMQGCDVLDNARARMIPKSIDEPLPLGPLVRWVVTYHNPAWAAAGDTPEPRITDVSTICCTEAFGISERDAWRQEADKLETGNVFDLAVLLIPVPKTGA